MRWQYDDFGSRDCQLMTHCTRNITAPAAGNVSGNNKRYSNASDNVGVAVFISVGWQQPRC
jgi:hypothetical protein